MNETPDFLTSELRAWASHQTKVHPTRLTAPMLKAKVALLAEDARCRRDRRIIRVLGALVLAMMLLLLLPTLQVLRPEVLVHLALGLPAPLLAGLALAALLAGLTWIQNGC